MTACVVRLIAASSALRRERIGSSTGHSQRALRNAKPSTPRALDPTVCSISAVVGVRDARKGLSLSRTIALASRTVAVSLGGVEACPPGSSTMRRNVFGAFSPTPTKAMGAVIPGKASRAIAPPSSSTSAGRTPRLSSRSTTALAPVLAVSSSCPNTR